jgi:hypothetical protein
MVVSRIPSIEPFSANPVGRVAGIVIVAMGCGWPFTSVVRASWRGAKASDLHTEQVDEFAEEAIDGSSDNWRLDYTVVRSEALNGGCEHSWSRCGGEKEMGPAAAAFRRYRRYLS